MRAASGQECGCSAATGQARRLALVSRDDADAVPASEPSELLAPVLGADALERGANSLQLDDLGIAEMTQQQRGAILPEQDDRRCQREREDADTTAPGGRTATKATASRVAFGGASRQPAPSSFHRLLVRRRRERRRTRSPRPSGCSAGSTDPARRACEAATPGRRSRGRRPRGRGAREHHQLLARERLARMLQRRPSPARTRRWSASSCRRRD